MRQFMSIAKALADENRVRALLLIDREGELCLCQLIGMLGLSPSTVSKHMSQLHAAGLLDCRKEGRWHYYRLRDRGAEEPVRLALRWVRASLRDEPIPPAEARRVRAVLCADKKKLCACYGPGAGRNA